MSDPPSQPQADSPSAERLPPITLLVAVTATWIVAQLSYYAQPQLLEQGPLRPR